MATDGQPTIVTKVKEKKNIVYGVFIGLAASWAIGGFKGENTGLLMLVAVGIFIWYTSRGKPKGKTIYDVIREAVALHKEKTGQSLNWKTARVFYRGGDRYFVQFRNPTAELTIIAPGVKGTREITDRTAESMKTETDNIYLDTHVYEVE